MYIFPITLYYFVKDPEVEYLFSRLKRCMICSMDVLNVQRERMHCVLNKSRQSEHRNYLTKRRVVRDEFFFRAFVL